jgi:Rrf2 family protein
MGRSSQFSVAVHVCVALAYQRKQGQEPVSSEHLAEGVNTNAAYLRRVISRLVKAGLLSSQAGKQGGVMLARDPAQITLADIYEAMDDTALISVHQQAPNKHCPVSCKIKDLMTTVGDSVESATKAVLARTSVAALVRQV